MPSRIEELSTDSSTHFDSPKVVLKDGKILLQVEAGVFDEDGKKVGEGKASSSNKSLVIATTRGNVPMELDGVTYMVGLNIYRKK